MAGSGKAGFADGIGTAAKFGNPGDIVMDHAKGRVIVVDNRVRAWNCTTGEVTTIAGSGRSGCSDGSCKTAAMRTTNHLVRAGDILPTARR